jgi:uncharacterized membrane protein
VSPTVTSNRPPENGSSMAGIVERNIRALIEHRRKAEESKSLQDQIADSVTRFTGSLAFVYLHLVFFGLWIVVNLGWTPRLEFDSTFVVLAMFASVEAIFLSTFVLITQNRMALQAERRAELDLQVSLLAEHEVTRLIEIVSAIADRFGVEVAHDRELPELKRDVHPEEVLNKIDETEERHSKSPG